MNGTVFYAQKRLLPEKGSSLPYICLLSEQLFESFVNSLEEVFGVYLLLVLEF